MWQFLLPAAMSLLGGGMQAFGHRRKPNITNIPRFTSQQQSALNQLLSQGMANTDFGPIEQRARQQFTSQTVPSIAEAFTSMGEGGRHSSGFMGELGLAGSDLESQLAALRSQFGMQQLQAGLTPQFESMVEPGGPGAMQAIGQGLMQGGMAGFPSGMQAYGMGQQEKIRNAQFKKLLDFYKENQKSGQSNPGYSLGGNPYMQGGLQWLS